MRQALGSGDIDFWRTTFLFHPGGVDLVQHTHTALNAWIGATVLGGLSEITALNLVRPRHADARRLRHVSARLGHHQSPRRVHRRRRVLLRGAVLHGAGCSATSTS